MFVSLHAVAHLGIFYTSHSTSRRVAVNKFCISVGRNKLSRCAFFQLRAEVGCLQGALEGKRAEMETLDTLLQRRERESQEGGNLLKMLTDDLQTAKEER